ncbi:hypothetical protein OEZ85_005346 [Tetradesmus obliquus]|uniref:Major facilitator superfamily (MFS) profile domain-containing protein n=1 Tax=Tetradesmus obliquus TaxID=3088 RepID=A0ABY8UHL4_TETOB|nr:hypothetical protein OEZ85_005346 [Tetradesmus obliquus]
MPLLWQRVVKDPACNRKLVALSVSQLLFSFATYMHDAYLPVYLQDVLGLSNTKIGAAQGVAQMLCQFAKGFAGVAGDILDCQVCVLLAGTFITLSCKLMFAALGTVNAVAGVGATVAWFMATRFLDRMAKGLRDAPAKAITNDLAKRSGDAPDAAYGLRQSLATAGALLGSSVAGLVFIGTGQSYEATFVAAVIPPAVAAAWLMTQFRDELSCRLHQGRTSTDSFAGTPASKAGSTAASTAAAAAAAAVGAEDTPAPAQQYSLPQKLRALVAAFKPAYWQALAVAAVVYFTRFDAAFVGLRAKQVMPASHIPLLYLLNSLLQTLLTAPLSKLSGSSIQVRNRLLGVGLAAMALGNWVFASQLTGNMPGMFLGASLLGIHMALTHSTITAMVAVYMPHSSIPGIGKLGGTAVSFTDFLLGFALVASNMLAGCLSDWTNSRGLGNTGCFYGGGCASLAALLLLTLFARFGSLGRKGTEA